MTYLYRRWLRSRSDWTLRIWPVLPTQKGEFGSKDFRTEPHDFVSDGDKVVVLTTIHLDGEAVESADVLTYNGGDKLVAFESCSDARVADRVFAK